MNRYNPGTPRKALALAAAAIATLSFGLLVVVPAKMGYDEGGSATVIAMHDLGRLIARSSRPAVATEPGKPATTSSGTVAKG